MHRAVLTLYRFDLPTHDSALSGNSFRIGIGGIRNFRDHFDIPLHPRFVFAKYEPLQYANYNQSESEDSEPPIWFGFSLVLVLILVIVGGHIAFCANRWLRLLGNVFVLGSLSYLGLCVIALGFLRGFWSR